MLTNAYLAYRTVHKKMSKSEFVDQFVKEACAAANFYTRRISTAPTVRLDDARGSLQLLKTAADDGHRLVHSGLVHWHNTGRGKPKLVVEAGSHPEARPLHGHACTVCLANLGPKAHALREKNKSKRFVGAGSAKNEATGKYDYGPNEVRAPQSVYRCVGCAAKPTQKQPGDKAHSSTGNMCAECFEYSPRHSNCIIDEKWNTEVLQCNAACTHRNVVFGP